MAGFFIATKNDKARVVTLRRVAENTGDAVFLTDAAEAALPQPSGAMPFTDLVTYAAAVKNTAVYQVPYDANKGPSVITTVGQTQYSADGTTWVSTIPDGVMVAGSSVSFFIRTNPASLVRPDDGSYVYSFSMVAAGSGGLTLANVGVNKARVSGTTPIDQAGVTFSVNCSVTDISSNTAIGTALTKVWG